MSGSYVLLQFGADFCNGVRFEDLEGRLAYTVRKVEENPNLILKLAQEAPWSQQHPEIMGPSSSFFYFGPSRAPGYLVYGNNPTQAMAHCRRQKKDASMSRYFTTRGGAEYKWRLFSQRLECVDNRGNLIAVWETAQLEDEFHARLTVKHSGLAIVTEILTTLTLNRIALSLKW